MTSLVPMKLERFASYMEAAVAAYAEENVTSGRWPLAGAMERSRTDFLSLLPQGLGTPDNFLFEIVDQPGGTPVGVLWFAIEARHGIRSAFVYDLEIHPEWRRQGHARRAFAALETIVAALGLDRIGLHVFGHNKAAQALYTSLGYQITGYNMTRQLTPPRGA